MRQFCVLALLLWSAACAPQLGDDCQTSADCSINNDRECDISQPGGYCTIRNCEANGCGEEGRCVMFDPDVPRRSVTFCMAKCDNGSDCRSAYACVRADSAIFQKPDGTPGARVLDTGGANWKFCAAKEEEQAEE